MYNLFYTSFATEPFSQAQLDQMLMQARERNKQDEITGLLLYYEGTFVQILEGDESKVKTTFDRIAKDSRHHSITNVFFTNASRRYFPDWQMGFKSMTAEEFAKIENHEISEIKQYFKSSQPYKVIRLLSRNHWTH